MFYLRVTQSPNFFELRVQKIPILLMIHLKYSLPALINAAEIFRCHTPYHEALVQVLYCHIRMWSRRWQTNAQMARQFIEQSTLKSHPDVPKDVPVRVIWDVFSVSSWRFKDLSFQEERRAVATGTKSACTRLSAVLTQPPSGPLYFHYNPFSRLWLKIKITLVQKVTVLLLCSSNIQLSITGSSLF